MLLKPLASRPGPTQCRDPKLSESLDVSPSPHYRAQRKGADRQTKPGGGSDQGYGTPIIPMLSFQFPPGWDIRVDIRPKLNHAHVECRPKKCRQANRLAAVNAGPDPQNTSAPPWPRTSVPGSGKQYPFGYSGDWASLLESTLVVLPKCLNTRMLYVPHSRTPPN